MSRFAPKDPRDLAALVRGEVLGIVTTHHAEGFIATPLPLLPETDASGRIFEFFGHFALANPHVELARTTPRALISFLGPHAYIAPAAVSKPTWAPTWNYQFAAFEVEIRFVPEENDHAVRQLVEAMEGDGEDAWVVERIGARFDELVKRIAAFRARVVRTSARFKLGQDEDRETFEEILTSLGDHPLAAAMRGQDDR